MTSSTVRGDKEAKIIETLAYEEVLKAKTYLARNYPFYSYMLCRREVQANWNHGTMATDGKDIFYNPAFTIQLALDRADPLDDLKHISNRLSMSAASQHIIFVLAHEIWHMAFGHIPRRRNRKHGRFMAACDVVVNEMLQQEKIGTRPSWCGIYDSALYQQGHGIIEEIHDLLPEDPPETFDAFVPAEAGEDDESIDVQNKIDIIAAAHYAKLAGKLSRGVETLIKDIIEDKTDWRDVLASDVTSLFSSGAYTYARPLRRMMAHGMYLASPTLDMEISELVVAIDYSGSVNETMKAQFIGVVNKIKEDTHPGKVTVIYFDSSVLGVEEFSKDQSIKLKFYNGGGTSFIPAMEEVIKRGIQPVAMIYLTDMYGPFPSEPNFPVIWCSVSDVSTAPFGKVIQTKAS